MAVDMEAVVVEVTEVVVVAIVVVGAEEEGTGVEAEDTEVEAVVGALAAGVVGGKSTSFAMCSSSSFPFRWRSTPGRPPSRVTWFSHLKKTR